MTQTALPIRADLHLDPGYGIGPRLDIDISDALIEALETDEDVMSLATAPADYDHLGEIIQMHDSYEVDGEVYQWMPKATFDFAGALQDATNRRYGPALLPAWHGWKDERTSPEARSAVLNAQTDEYIQEFETELAVRPQLRTSYGMKALIRSVLSLPGARDVLVDAIAEADIPTLDAMKTIRDLPK
jgi:hypothetical protein